MKAGEYTTEQLVRVTWGDHGRFQAILMHTWMPIWWVAMYSNTTSVVHLALFAAQEFDLDSVTANITGVVFYAGITFGGATLAKLSDTYGRKPSSLWGYFLTLVASIARAFAPNFEIFLGLTFVIGSILSAVSCFGYAWIIEFCRAEYRGRATSYTTLQGIFGQLFMVLPGAVATSLTQYCLILAIPVACIVVATLFVPRSPRYLALAGKTDQATAIMYQVARINGKPLPEGVRVADASRKLEMSGAAGDDAKVNKKVKDERGAIKDLLKPPLFMYTAILSLLAAASFLLVYGITFLATGLEGNTSINTAIIAASELPGNLFMVFGSHRVGRRSVAKVGYSGAGVALLIAAVLPWAPAQLAAICVAKLCGATATVASWAIVVELYPTSVRSTGVGLVTSVGRSLGMVAPLVIAALDTVPIVILFGSIALLAAFASLKLPETASAPLEDSITKVKSDARLVTRAATKVHITPRALDETSSAAAELVSMDHGAPDTKPVLPILSPTYGIIVSDEATDNHGRERVPVGAPKEVRIGDTIAPAKSTPPAASEAIHVSDPITTV